MAIGLNLFTENCVLNIFCDASVKNFGGEQTGCFGAVAISGDDIVCETYHIANDTTNNNSEIKGMRDAINIAAMYKGSYPIINIFCDSEQAVAGVRDRIPKWKILDGIMYTKQGSPVQSQNVYAEIVNTIMRYNLKVNIFEVKGHVNPRSEEALKYAKLYFKDKNKIYKDVDLDLIEYLESWNEYIDLEVKAHLDNCNYRARYEQPIEFIPTRFDKKKYNKLTKLEF